MELALLDWLIIAAFFVISLLIGLKYTKQAGQDTSHFFLGGRNLSWWIAGTSMVATTFAADTPLAVTELVATGGIAGNWLWWNMLAGGMLTTFFFAKFWRRANILTDIELIEIRYSGKPAAFLRGFRAIYMGIFMNALIIGWVNVALVAILQVFFNIPNEQSLWYVAAAMFIVVIYTSMSGLLGVAITDVVQFIIAMGGCIILAIIVVSSDEIGGITGLKEKLPSWSLSFFPNIGGKTTDGTASNLTTLTLSLGSFLAFVGVQWWAAWYPGAEPGGGGYVAQRMMSAKNERHAIIATLFFQIAHYCLRPWPWILVGLCSLVLYPELSVADKKLGFVMTMKDFLPVGLKGLLLVAFLAAYMSTISTQLNWGTSYLVNDFYRRFVKPDASEKSLVTASRVATLIMMLVALFATSRINSISAVWQFIIECGAGLGLVLILRWYWWRINAWSEITATLVPFIAYGVSKFVLGWTEPIIENPRSFFFTVGVTTISWLVITFVTQPTDRSVLASFYNKIKPDGAWGPFQQANSGSSGRIGILFVCWISSVVMTYSMLFLIGELIFMEWARVLIYLVIVVASAAVLFYTSSRIKIFED
ncbi:Na+:solute symporter [Rhodocytophaga rosea]|uniref:Na+:solute symporter n=1 Tax=Rhodocytophaga rosea TaxID=2704465 RepID=A0A6C0GIA8_9BACT|nr:sodium:solute symporter family protein [Rhodocytophaga rosea]QHT67699.1 Na+:solute symporter [Rhodocytophaga rosea]